MEHPSDLRMAPYPTSMEKRIGWWW